jgi:polysaccharide biosynthesis/export protein
MKKILFPWIVASLAVALCGCASTQPKTGSGSAFSELPSSAPAPAAAARAGSVTFTNVGDNALAPALTRPEDGLFTLGPGDRLEIEVLGHPETRAQTFVGPDGKIYYQLLAGQDVWGLTLAQTRTKLEKELVNYLSEPQVVVTLREVASKQVWLLGRLNRPGVYPLNGPTTLLELMALGGGVARTSTDVTTAELGDLRHSFVMRQGKFLPVDFHKLLLEGDTSQNIFLQPDDFVYVPSALSQEVYVLGSVRYPRTVPYLERMTLMTALAGASGAVQVEWLAPTTYIAVPDADLSHVAVVRGSLAKPQIAVVDVSGIMKGKVLDMPLEPGDIVYVPNTPFSTLKRYFNTIVNTFVTTVAVNAGSAVGGGTTVGVAVPVGGK